MAELFRYIQHAFVVPTATKAIDVADDTDLQIQLRAAASQKLPAERVRSLADGFLRENFPTPLADPFGLGAGLRGLRGGLLALKTPSRGSVDGLITTLFDAKVDDLTASKEFLADRGRLDDALICVKLLSAFDRVDAAGLATMRRAVAYVEDLAGGDLTDFSAEAVRAAFARPIRIPQAFLDAIKPTPKATPTPAPTDDPAQRERAALLARQSALASAYLTIMAVQPHELELKAAQPTGAKHAPAKARAAEPEHAHEPTRAVGRAGVADASERGAPSLATRATASAPTFLALAPSVVGRLGDTVVKTLRESSIDVANAPVPQVVGSIKRQWQEVSRQLAPYQVPAPSPVFRVGIHLFAVNDQAAQTAAPALPSPAPAMVTAPITRPVGVGDLLVVRQELVGYEAREISHIENVLEGEVLKRSTLREEVNELTVSVETDTTQVDERDQQSTSRNELSTEAQKESGGQTTSVTDQTTSTDYGKLVENSKTNYARSVTDRAVNTLTQMVKQQRVQREKKTFREKAVHELDNRKGAEKVRGIYQWVDKKYKARILNYGKRLLYDVVVPEPAAFLIDSLKQAAQPENFQLTKPVDPQISPTDLDPSSYMDYATRYGVTGSVSPPPDEFIQTVAVADAKDVTGTINAYGTNWNRSHYAGFKITIPDTHKAVSGYIQHTNVAFTNAANRLLEFFIGEHRFVAFSASDYLNVSFLMDGETGEIPVTLCTIDDVIQFNYAIGINCQRTDKAYEQWQLKTHATIVSGYQRQLADYQDKLAQYQAAMRSQLALASNYAHDSSVEEQELKKAFLFLLLSEHFGQAFHPTPNPEAIPPNPAAVHDWGAMVAFFERAFEWENIMYTYYPYFWGRKARWGELILIQDTDPQFEAFLKAGAARVVIPVRPGFEAALAHFQETGEIWMGEEMPDMFGDYYVSIIDEIKARNFAPGKEICVSEWDVTLPTTLVMLKDDATLPSWPPSMTCNPPADA